MLDELFQDFRISVRGLLRTPLFAVTVILRLNVFPIRTPALRERLEDIPALVRHFVLKSASHVERKVSGAFAGGA